MRLVSAKATADHEWLLFPDVLFDHAGLNRGFYDIDRFWHDNLRMLRYSKTRAEGTVFGHAMRSR
jgi:hypothetical protein